MERFSFIFTIFFMLLGPVKLIPLFAGLTRGADTRFKRAAAVRGVVIAGALCAFIALAGGALLGKYGISLEALRIAAGLVLLIAALQIIFQKAPASSPGPGDRTPLQLAVSPIAVPGIVPPAGIAAILICVMLAPAYPGMLPAIAICLAIMMALDFLVMYYIDPIMKMPGLPIILTTLGSFLVFVQVCLAVETLLTGFKGLGVLQP